MFLNIAHNTHQPTKIKWIIGVLTDGYSTLHLITRNEPNGVAMKELSSNSTARLYYTLYDSSISGYHLYKEDVNLRFNVTNQKFETAGKNCGSQIRVTGDIVVLSCFPTDSSQSGIISVFRESDLYFMHTEVDGSNSFSIGLDIEVISEENYVSYSFKFYH